MDGFPVISRLSARIHQCFRRLGHPFRLALSVTVRNRCERADTSGWLTLTGSKRLGVGREVGEEPLPGIPDGTGGRSSPAGVLPDLPGAVPMEAEFGQLLAQVHGGRLVELDPHPPPHHLGAFVEVGSHGPEPMHQTVGAQEAVSPTKAEVDRGQRGAGGLFGAAGEPCKRE